MATPYTGERVEKGAFQTVREEDPIFWEGRGGEGPAEGGDHEK